MNVSKLNIGPTAQFGQQNLLQEHRAQKQKRAPLEDALQRLAANPDFRRLGRDNVRKGMIKFFVLILIVHIVERAGFEPAPCSRMTLRSNH